MLRSCKAYRKTWLLAICMYSSRTKSKLSIIFDTFGLNGLLLDKNIWPA